MPRDPLTPRVGPIDIVYRWCNPARLSGDGKVIRSRDNHELTYSLMSVARFMPWVRHIHVVHAGDPPTIHSDPVFDYSELRGRIFLHRERWLMKRASRHLALKPKSRNSEPVKLALPWITGLADRFILMDDDYILTRPAVPAMYFADRGRPIFPDRIKGCHRPLPFVRDDYADYVLGLPKKRKRYFFRSSGARRDVLPEMVDALVASHRGRRNQAWVTLKADAPRLSFRRARWRLFDSDWLGLTAFLGWRGRGRFNLWMTRLFLRIVEWRRPTTMCVNDNWDVDDRWYTRQTAMYREFMAAYLTGAGPRL